MPFRVFAAGEVLTAANVNDYLAEQAIATFAGTAARASAITAPTEGQFAYLSDSDSLTFYNGSAWVNAGSAIAGTALSSGTASSGQVLTANGSGAVTFSTPTQGLTLINTTSFSAVSSQSINDVFSSSFDHYRIISQINTSVNSDVLMRLRVSGTDASGATDYLREGYIVRTNGAVASFASSTGTNQFYLGYNFAGEDSLSSALDIFQPNKAQRTRLVFLSHNSDSTSYFAMWSAQSHQLSTAYTGITVYPSSGNMTGSISIFGYNK